MKTDGEPTTRGQVGRWVARFEIVIAGLVVFVIQPFLFISAPPAVRPMFAGEDWHAAVSLAGVAAQLAALALMIRWYRADPEPDQHAWRYRAD
jgi:hypothetical protein